MSSGKDNVSKKVQGSTKKKTQDKKGNIKTEADETKRKDKAIAKSDLRNRIAVNVPAYARIQYRSTRYVLDKIIIDVRTYLEVEQNHWSDERLLSYQVCGLDVNVDKRVDRIIKVSGSVGSLPLIDSHVYFVISESGISDSGYSRIREKYSLTSYEVGDRMIKCGSITLKVLTMNEDEIKNLFNAGLKISSFKRMPNKHEMKDGNKATIKEKKEQISEDDGADISPSEDEGACSLPKKLGDDLLPSPDGENDNRDVSEFSLKLYELLRPQAIVWNHSYSLPPGNFLDKKGIKELMRQLNLSELPSSIVISAEGFVTGNAYCVSKRGIVLEDAHCKRGTLPYRSCHFTLCEDLEI